jgi:hypothetical protein
VFDVREKIIVNLPEKVENVKRKMVRDIIFMKKIQKTKKIIRLNKKG